VEARFPPPSSINYPRRQPKRKTLSLDVLFPGSHTLGLRELVSSPDANVDIILIHGLWGDSFKTWLHGNEERGVSWPAELPSQDFPSARNFGFGYDANVVSVFDRMGQGSSRDQSRFQLW
jgi:hypothetical protein